MAMDYQLLDKIREIQRQGRTGLLQLEKEGREITVYFHDGLIDGAGSNIAHLKLGKILAGRGIFQSSVVPKLLEKARRKHMLLGRTAVWRKLLDDEDLKEAINDQIIQTFSFALSSEFRIRAFKDSDVDLYLPARLDLDCLVLELARCNLKPLQLDPSGLLSLNNGRSLSHLPWYPQELSVLSHLKTPCTLQDLAGATGIEYVRLGKILSVFDSLRLLNRVETPQSESTALVKREGFPFEHLTPEIGSFNLSSKLETLLNPTSFISEQFKTLKVRLAEVAAQAPLRVIAVSSPNAGDGKSLVSANLAISLSKDKGRRVVIVDCDLRNPSLHKLLGASVEPGLLGFLDGDYLQPYCYLRRLESLYVMTAGGIANNPIELLSNPRMHELIAYLKTEFDVVILDCPPFGPIADAQILTGLADGFLMVVRCGKTTYRTIENAFERLDRNKLIGLIFNDVKPMLFSTQYHYRYYNYGDRSYYPYAKIKVVRRPKTYLE
jgi:capsular exopolysaccharide synthesis family protein